MKLKCGLGKLLGRDGAELVSHPAAHLDSEIETAVQFLGLNIFGGPVGIEKLEQTGYGLRLST